MKELSIEDKAKRYDEAVEIISDYYQKIKYSSLSCASNDIEVLEKAFPQLKESEDERIRRVLREIVLQWKNGHQAWCTDDKEIDTILAWLEKQGNLMKALQISNAKIGELIEKNYYLKEQLEKQGEQKPAIKLERDKNGEPILTPFEAELFSMMSDAWQGYQLGEEVNIAEIVKENSSELLERANEQKPAWSEEEIENCAREAEDNNCIILAKHIRQLKSLRPQSTWKPSEEQLDSLRIAIGDEQGSDCCGMLRSLLKDLKSL